MITHDELKRILRYDPLTGSFIWLIKPKVRNVNIGSVAGTKTSTRNRIKIRGTLYLASRLAWLYMTGSWPDALVDHINGDPLDDRWSNLRAATVSQNQQNRRSRGDSTAPYKGITLANSGVVRWVAKIRANGERTKHLGTFDTPEEAHAAYVDAAKKLFGEFARS